MQSNDKPKSDNTFGEIHLKLEEVMKAQNISKNKVCFRTEIQRSRLNAYYRNEIQRVDLSILAKLCHVLHCDVSDLIEYIPAKEEKE